MVISTSSFCFREVREGIFVVLSNTRMTQKSLLVAGDTFALRGNGDCNISSL